jgi:hypothetical protein
VSDDLRYVLDLEALRALVQRYARAADARDYDAMAELFHPDAEIDGLWGASPLDEYLDRLRTTPAAYDQSMHTLGDPLVELEPGADVASLDTYAVVYQLASREDGSNATMGMRYFDEVERRDGRWRIRRRRTEMRWVTK